jgi:mono/diheme cytochrome c family protein
MAILIAVAVMGGTGCGVAQTYTASTYQAAYVAPTYSYQQQAVPIYYPSYQYSYRASYAGLPVGSEESARQLLIIEQQSKALAKVLEQQSSRIQALESEKQVEIERLRTLSEQHQQPLAPVQQEPNVPQAPVPNPPEQKQQPPAKASLPISGQHAQVIGLFTQKCGQCHSGEQGKTHDWEMNTQALLNPTPELRIYVTNALNRKQNPMPKGRTLTDEERRAFAEWGSFSKEELKARLVSR